MFEAFGSNAIPASRDGLGEDFLHGLRRSSSHTGDEMAVPVEGHFDVGAS